MSPSLVRRGLAAALLMLALAPSAALAAPAGTLSGQVVDAASGAPVASVRVFRWKEDAPDGVASSSTDAQGHFRFAELAPGTYSLVVDDGGPDVWLHGGVEVVADGATQAELKIPRRPAPPPPAPPKAPAGAGAYGELIAAAAARHGLDPKLVASVIRVESSFNPRAVSGSGAKGLMQLMDGTAKLLGVADPFDPAQNVEGGTRYLAEMLRRFGTVELALAAYHAGPGAVARAGGPPTDVTRGYVTKIMGYWRAAG